MANEGDGEEENKREEKPGRPAVTKSKLTKGTNLLKMVDIRYLDEIDPKMAFNTPYDKTEPHLSVVAVAQGWHLCHDVDFENEFNNEFQLADHCPSEALKSGQGDLGKLFGAPSFYNESYFTVQECQEHSLLEFMDSVKDNKPRKSLGARYEEKQRKEKAAKAAREEQDQFMDEDEGQFTLPDNTSLGRRESQRTGMSQRRKPGQQQSLQMETPEPNTLQETQVAGVKASIDEPHQFNVSESIEKFEDLMGATQTETENDHSSWRRSNRGQDTDDLFNQVNEQNRLQHQEQMGQRPMVDNNVRRAGRLNDNTLPMPVAGSSRPSQSGQLIAKTSNSQGAFHAGNFGIANQQHTSRAGGTGSQTRSQVDHNKASENNSKEHGAFGGAFKSL